MRNARVVCLCAASIVVASPAGAQPRPGALVKLAQGRGVLTTGHVEWTWHNEKSGMTRLWTSRFGAETELLVSRGDQEGVISRLPDGRPNPRKTTPHNTLLTPEYTWQYGAHELIARRRERRDAGNGGIWRMRALGASAFLSMHDIDATLWQDRVPQPGARQYEQSTEDGLQVVTAQTDYGAIKWWIDAERGCSPVRVALVVEGEILRESRSTLKNWGGVWFPETVAFFSASYKDGHEPIETVQVHYASFNRPEHPQHLTPREVGIEVGVNVHTRRGDGSVEFGIWDGQSVISSAEYGARLRSGELEEGPTVLREAARLAQLNRKQAQTGGADVGVGLRGPQARRAFESAWETYTRRFIERYRLNAEQAARAYAILKDCQERANQYLAKRAKDFEKLDKEAEALRKSDAKDRAQRLAAVDKRHRKLMQPIDEIFEKQLKPRLEKLPTSAQRRAAEEREKATSKPAKAGGGQP